MRWWLFCAIPVLSLFVSSCKNSFTGDLKSNQTPETNLVTDTIARSGADRFTSQVHLQWWGQDPDGYVAAYEVSYDGLIWVRTTKQDSVFTLSLPVGSDTADFHFKVRAVDNQGAVDPTPATLTIPVKNSPPTAEFFQPTAVTGNYSRNPEVSFPVLRYTFQCNDPDGTDNLDHLEFFLNDTSQPGFVVNPGVTALTLLAANPGASTSICQVFLGNSSSAQANTLSGLQLDATNVLYIRAVDKVGAHSPCKASTPIWVKKVNSPVLLVNAYKSVANKSNAQAFYANALTNAGIPVFDTLQATEVVNNNYTQLAPDNSTQARTFALFKHIVWFTDDADFSLSLGQKTTSTFFQNGGTCLMAVGFSTNIDPQANYLDFTPVKSLVPQPSGQTFRLVSGANLTAALSGFPTLQVSASPFIARPLFKQDDGVSYSYQYVYNGTIKVSGGVSKDWTQTDSTNLMVMRTPVGGTPDFILSGVPIEKLDGAANSLQFFQEALINRLRFK